MGSLSTKIVAIITAILIFVSLYLIFGYARVEGTMLEVQKIFYYHVSAALTVFVAFGVNCVFSIKYLIQRKSNDDLLAVAAAELGLIFCTIALLSGPIWARYAWNTWWKLGTTPHEYAHPLADVRRLFYSPFRFGRG